MLGRNVEIKARLKAPADTLKKARKLTSAEPEILSQIDIFFTCPNGRLKLRILSPGYGELIFYQRSDTTEPVLSTYSRYPVKAPSELRELLSQSLGVLGTVQKKRTLLQIEQTRIHIDEVEKLGNFIELEVVLAPEQTVDQGQLIATQLMQHLQIRDEDLIDCAYIDLLRKQQD